MLSTMNPTHPTRYREAIPDTRTLERLVMNHLHDSCVKHKSICRKPTFFDSINSLPPGNEDGPAELSGTGLTHIVNIVVDKIVEFLSDKYHEKVQLITTLSVTSLATSVVTFVMSIINVCKNPTTLMTKWVIPLTQLIQVATSVALVCASMNVNDFSVEKCTAQLTTLIERYTSNQPTLDDIVAAEAAARNALDANYVLGVACNCITMIMCVGCSIAGVEVKTLNSLLTLREKTKNLSTDMKQVASGVIYDTFGYDVDMATSVTTMVTDLVQRAGEMSRLSQIDFLTNSARVIELEKLLKDIEKLQTAKLTDQQARAYSQARTTLNHQYLALNQVLKNIQELSKNKARPVTVGFVLDGIPGIGKSNVTRYILKTISKKMGFSPGIFNLEMGPHGQFSEIYLRQACGEYHEFAKLHDNTKAVYSLNSILSDDQVNFEAANVEQKIQPCMLRIVGLTVNRPDLYFRSELVESANAALITRVMELTVEDTQFQGRGQPNLHRTPDYKHLTFVWKKLKNAKPMTLEDTKDRTLYRLNIDQLITVLTNMVAANEIHFLTTQLADMNDMSPDMRKTLEARIAQLRELYVEPIMTEAGDFSLPIPPRKQNACNTSFFVARWQGPRGFGKTTQANNFCRLMKKLFKMETYHVTDRDFKEIPKTSNASVFVIDDVPIDEENATAYHMWINALPKNSIVLLITNDVVPPEPITRLSQRHLASSMGFATFQDLPWSHTFQALKRVLSTPTIRAFHLDNYPKIRKVLDKAPGLARRLGFAGLQVVDNEYVDPPRQCGVCLTVGRHDFINLEPQGTIDLAFTTSKAYIEYMRSSEDILVVQQTPPPVKWDVWIEVRDFSLFKTRATTEVGYYNMFMKEDDPAGKVHIDVNAINRMLSVTDVRAWVIPNLNDADQILPIAVRSINKLVNAFPDVTIKITSDGRTLFYHNGVIYDNQSPQQELGQVIDGLLYVNGTLITPVAIAQLMVNGVAAGRPLDLPNVSPAELLFAVDYVKNHRYEPGMELYHLAVDDIVSKIDKWQNAKDHPYIVWLSKSSLGRNLLLGTLAAVTAVGAAYGLYKLCAADAEPHSVPNGADNASSGGKDSSHEDSSARREEAYNKTRGPKGHQYHWSRNATPTVPARAVDYTKKSKEELQEIIQNLVNPSINMVKGELSVAQNARLEAILNKLRQNVCRVSTLNGICHGIVLYSRYILTVKHIVYDCDDIGIIWAPTKSVTECLYPAEIIAMDHARDIAILEVTDPTFPQGVNITSYITHADITDTWRADALYIRPLQNTEIVHGQAYHSERHRTPLGVPTDPTWNPTRYYDFTPIHLGVGSAQVRKGDCGLPLIREVEGHYYIIGINCALANTGEANFSMVCKQSLSDLLDKRIARNSLDKEEFNIEPSTLIPIYDNVPDYNQYLEKIDDSTRYDNHPEMQTLGYARDLLLVSTPKHSRTLISPLNIGIQTTSARSLIEDKDIPPQAVEHMAKDVNGKPSLHLTQALKNYKRLPVTISMDEFNEATHNLTEYIKFHVGTDIKKLRTFQVINGMLGEPLKGMSQAASAGPYMKLKHRIQSKKQLFKVVSAPEQPQVLGFADTPAGRDVAEQYFAMIHLVENGQSPLFVVKDNLKVELLPREKVDRGESRLYCEPDTATNMLLRRYLGAFQAAVVECHAQLGIAVGANPYTFPTFMHTHTPTFFTTVCTDLKRQDKTVEHMYIDMFFDVVAACMPDVEKQVWEALKQMLYWVVHVYHGLIYLVRGGNASGMFGTTLLNTIIVLHQVIRLFTKQKHLIGLRYFTISSFTANVKASALGDDLHLRTNPQLQITFELLREGFAECGLECVPSKTPAGELGDFCSRAYYWDENEHVVYPGLKESTIIDLVLWVHLKDPEITAANFALAMFEASLRDEPFFNKIVRGVKIQSDFLQIKGIDYFPYKTYRKHFAQYVRGEQTSPMLTDIGPNIVYDFSNDSANYPKMDYVEVLLRAYGRAKIDFDGVCTTRFNATTRKWVATLTIRGTDYVGEHARKSTARNYAYQDAYNAGVAPDPVRNAGTVGMWHKHSLRYRTEPSRHGDGRVIAVYLDSKRLDEISRRPEHLTADTSEGVVQEMISSHLDDVEDYIRMREPSSVWHDQEPNNWYNPLHDSFTSLDNLSVDGSSVEEFIGMNRPDSETSDTDTGDEMEHEPFPRQVPDGWPDAGPEA